MPHFTAAKEASEEMSQPKHTPGPWKLDLERNTRIRGNGKDVAVALVSSSEKFTLSQREAEANARLISASPDLLESTVELNRQLDRFWNGERDENQIKRIEAAQQQCLRAVTKATAA